MSRIAGMNGCSRDPALCCWPLATLHWRLPHKVVPCPKRYGNSTEHALRRRTPSVNAGGRAPPSPRFPTRASAVPGRLDGHLQDNDLDRLLGSKAAISKGSSHSHATEHERVRCSGACSSQLRHNGGGIIARRDGDSHKRRTPALGRTRDRTLRLRQCRIARRLAVDVRWPMLAWPA